MSAEDLTAIKAAFVGLDAAMTAESTASLALAKAMKSVDAIEAIMLRSLPTGKPVHIPGTRFTLTSDGKEIAIHEDTPVLTLEDLAA